MRQIGCRLRYSAAVLAGHQIIVLGEDFTCFCLNCSRLVPLQQCVSICGHGGCRRRGSATVWPNSTLSRAMAVGLWYVECNLLCDFILGGFTRNAEQGRNAPPLAIRLPTEMVLDALLSLAPYQICGRLRMMPSRYCLDLGSSGRAGGSPFSLTPILTLRCNPLAVNTPGGGLLLLLFLLLVSGFFGT